MTATESDRILADGVEIPLADGRTVALRYSLRSLKSFEDHFGSVGNAVDALNAILTGENEKKIGTIVPVLAFGLFHEAITADALYDGLAKPQMSVYFDAIREALDQAFPPTKASSGKDEPASSGAASTTPPTASAITATGSGE